MVVFLICATFFNGFLLFGRCCFGWFKGLSPIKYRVSFAIALSLALICCCSSTCYSFFFKLQKVSHPITEPTQAQVIEEVSDCS